MATATVDAPSESESLLADQVVAERTTTGRRFVPGRRAAVLAAGVLVASAVVASTSHTAEPSQPVESSLAADEVAQFWKVGDELNLGGSVSPVAAVKQSMKRNVLKVAGAFTGGTCNITGNETCPFENMPKDNLTGVFPGGKTGCFVKDGPPYLFQVVPGDADKLIIYFSGGGACWDQTTASHGLCSRACGFEGKPDTPELSGIFDHSQEKNPYKDHTAVILGYCTGDAHVGTQTQQWTMADARGEKGGDIAYQKGYNNARAAIDWAKANFPDQLESLIITGSSAGSLGTQIWASTLLKEFKYDSAAVIADSYAGIFPAGVQGPMIRDFGLCTTDLLPSNLQSSCSSGLIDVQQIYEQTMEEFPEVTFANIDSKTDIVQMAFYDVVYYSKVSVVNCILLPEAFSQAMAMIYSRYNMRPNWISYQVNGNQHMYLNNDVMFQTSPVGNIKTGEPGQVGGKVLRGMGLEITGGEDLWLAPWLSNVPVKRGKSLKSACAALRKKPVPTPPPVLGIFGTMLHAGATVVSAAVTPFVELFVSRLGWNFCDGATTNKKFTRYA